MLPFPVQFCFCVLRLSYRLRYTCFTVNKRVQGGLDCGRNSVRGCWMCVRCYKNTATSRTKCTTLAAACAAPGRRCGMLMRLPCQRRTPLTNQALDENPGRCRLHSHISVDRAGHDQNGTEKRRRMMTCLSTYFPSSPLMCPTDYRHCLIGRCSKPTRLDCCNDVAGVLCLTADVSAQVITIIAFRLYIRSGNFCLKMSCSVASGACVYL